MNKPFFSPGDAQVRVLLSQRIESRIFLIRGQKVMLSPHLAELYGVAPMRLNEAVKRNRRRFPADFMFPLSKQEFANLKSQFAISSWGGARRALPYAFTEEGVAMLSAVLRSQTAIDVNIEIMRVFVRLRRVLSSHEPLRRKLAELERKLGEHDHQIALVFDAIRQLIDGDQAKPKPPIGYHTESAAND